MRRQRSSRPRSRQLNRVHVGIDPRARTEHRTRSPGRIRTGSPALRVRAKRVRGRKRRIQCIASERFVVSTLVTSLVADNRQQLEPFLVQDAAQRQSFGECHLGCVLRRAALVEDRPGQVDGHDLGEHRDAHVACDASSWSLVC